MDVSHCCAQCSYQTVWKFQLGRHVQRKHQAESAAFHAAREPERYSCFSCNYQTRFKLNQFEHCLGQHGGADTNIDRTCSEQLLPKYSCDKCKRTAHSSLCLAGHSCKVTRSVRCHKCTQCSYKTKCEAHLTINIATKPYRPDEKVTTWLNVAKWKTNLKQKLSRKPAETFGCTECSFRTKLKASLRRHVILKHARPEEIKWFGCAKCSYRSNSKTTLKRHMLTHPTSDNVWYTCTECDYRTVRKGYMKTHMMKHTDVKWLFCPECSYRAKHRSSMKKHKLKRHPPGEAIKTYWFMCGVCPFRTVHKISLKRHLITEHGYPVEAAGVQVNGAVGVAADATGEVGAETADVAVETVAVDAAVVHDKPVGPVAGTQIKTGRRPREPDTSPVLRATFVAMAEAGKSISEIARTFGKARACVRYWIRRGKEGGVEGLTTKTAGRGRPRITTQAEDEALVEMASEQPFFTATAIQQQAAVPCSAWTIRRRLKEAKKAK